MGFVSIESSTIARCLYMIVSGVGIVTHLHKCFNTDKAYYSVSPQDNESVIAANKTMSSVKYDTKEY